MIIDSHHHFWNFDPEKHQWISDGMEVLRRDFLPDEFDQILKTNNIDGCIAVQAENSEAENRFLLQLAEQCLFIKGIVGWCDFMDPKVEQKLEYFVNLDKIKGFRHIAQSEPSGFLLQGQFINGIRGLSEFDFTYDLLIYHHQMKQAIEFVRQVENVKIVLDHIGKPSIRTKELNQWKSNILTLGKFPNVFCKFSGLAIEANWSSWKDEDFTPYLDVALESFGVNRVMYGSDWPVCEVATNYSEQLGIIKKYISKLSASEQANIMGNNAIIFYNL